MALLRAPPGGGKTTALLHFAAQHSGVALVTLPPGASSELVERLLAGIRDAQVVVIDDVDVASPGGRDAVRDEIEANRGGCRYLLGGSARTLMPDPERWGAGVARFLDDSLLAFTDSDVRRLTEANRVAVGDRDVARLIYETDGWPLAVTWIVREAARTGRSLASVFDLVRRRGGEDSMEAFLSAAASVAEPASQQTLERLEGEGYPIVRTRASLRPNRILEHLTAQTSGGVAEVPVDERLALNLFGRFSCKIRGRAVPFKRRRDQNVLAFIALAPVGGASRDELREAFWPNASPAAASQGVRTTLSRLRFAIAQAADDDAERYLHVDRRICLEPDRVWVDVRRFLQHMASAKLAEESGDRAVARNHYLQAQRLHAGSLLSSEAIEGAFAPRVAECEQLYLLAGAQLAALEETHR